MNLRLMGFGFPVFSKSLGKKAGQILENWLNGTAAVC